MHTFAAEVSGRATDPSSQSVAKWRRGESIKSQFAKQNWTAAGVLFLSLLVLPMLPFFPGWMASQASLIVIYIIAAQGVCVLTGYTGLVSVGHGGFLAIGAYTSALLTKNFGIDLSLGILSGGLMSAFIGCLLGLVFLRLSGAFMAIGTLGFAFFVGAVINNIPFFEGREGIFLPKNSILGIEIGDYGFYYVSIVVLALVTIFLWNLVRSGVGRALKSLRDSEKAAESYGVSRLYYRTLAFTISAFVTGIAGALNAHIVNYVSAEVYSDIWYSVDILVAGVVGGPALLAGPFVGAVFVVMVPFFFEQMADFAFILKGMVLIGVLIFAPAGVVELVSRPIRNLRRRKLEEATGQHHEAAESVHKL